MSTLILCQACKRHVRRTESTCPFCAVQLSFDTPLQGEKRARGRPGGRAALFLAGAVTASATAGCTTSGVPVYGAPPDEDDSNDEQEGDGGTARDAASERDDGGSTVVPVYGTPIDTDAANPARDAGTRDASRTDATIVDDAALGTPVYGIPIDPRDSGAPACDVDGGSDGGARLPAPSDGGGDAAASCAPAADAEIQMPVPPYGVAIDSRDGG
jgi:hypothetical protein